jgi:hypothetical protein
VSAGTTTTVAWWPSVVTWVLVLAGWFAVHLATLARERRKERRELSKALVESLRGIEVDALAFHTAPAFNAVQADLLLHAIGRLLRSLQRIPMSELGLPLSRMVRVRKSVTLKNFDKSAFQTQQSGSVILTNIRASIDDLVEAIEAEREIRWK